MEPTTGESFFLFLPTLDQACFELFLSGLQQKVSEQTTAVVMDQAAAHGGEGQNWPEGLIPMPLPSYSPALNPMERVFEVLRERLANQIFDSVQDLQAALTAELKKFWENPQVLVSLTNFAWWQKALAEPPTLSFSEKVVQFSKISSALGKQLCRKRKDYIHDYSQWYYRYDAAKRGYERWTL